MPDPNDPNKKPTNQWGVSGNAPALDSANQGDAQTNFLYGQEDPTGAMSNVMADMGIPLWNPILSQYLLGSAKGLGASYSLDNANNPSFTGSKIDSFKNYLMSMLNGSGGGGSIQDELQKGLAEFRDPALRDKLRQQMNLNAAGVSHEGQNPAIGQLLALLNDPKAALEMQMALAGPTMGQGEAQGLNTIGQINQGRMARGGDFGNFDFLTALLGLNPNSPDQVAPQPNPAATAIPAGPGGIPAGAPDPNKPRSAGGRQYLVQS